MNSTCPLPGICPSVALKIFFGLCYFKYRKDLKLWIHALALSPAGFNNSDRV